jgi:hypothetical protein
MYRSVNIETLPCEHFPDNSCIYPPLKGGLLFGYLCHLYLLFPYQLGIYIHSRNNVHTVGVQRLGLPHSMYMQGIIFAKWLTLLM